MRTAGSALTWGRMAPPAGDGTARRPLTPSLAGRNLSLPGGCAAYSLVRGGLGGGLILSRDRRHFSKFSRTHKLPGEGARDVTRSKEHTKMPWNLWHRFDRLDDRGGR